MGIWLRSFIPVSTMKNKTWAKLLLAGLFPLLCAFFGLSLGSSSLPFFQSLGKLLQGDVSSPETRILLYVRLPRVCASLLAGAALAVSGVLIQAASGNPLAAPNVIGVNAGAGFFTFLSMALLPASRWASSLGAFLGALLATLVIYAVAAAAGAGKLTIILAGVAVSSIFTAGINTVKTFFPDTLYNGGTFLIGGFSGVSLKDITPAWGLILTALLLALLLARQTDVLCLGEETARSLGLPVREVRFGLILTACVLAGCAVSFSGLLSFVGLIVPHIARRLFGSSHRVLCAASCFLGAGFVALCDLLSRVLFAPYEIPVGILLSLLGGPFFLFLLLRGRKRGYSLQKEKASSGREGGSSL